MRDEVLEFIGGLRQSDNTKRAYARALNMFAQWADKEAPENQEEAQAFLDYREDIGKAPSTIAIDAAALERFLKWKKLPVDLQRPSVVLQVVKYLSKQEVKDLLEAAAEVPWLECLIALLYDSGARISEILSIGLEDINWGGYLQVRRKGGRPDVANVSPWGMQYLREWLDLRRGQSRTVFGDRNYRYAYEHLKKAARRARIREFTPHMLRHSRAVHIREDAGTDWVDIGYQLGHVNPHTTVKIYTRPMAEDLKKRIPAPSL